MNTLENIVLPLAESRALAEKVKLDTALVWVRDPNTGDISVDSKENGDVSLWSILCPAPTLSELLDAIRAKYSDKVITIQWHAPEYYAFLDWMGASSCRASGSTDLLAAYQLLLEVSK